MPTRAELEKQGYVVCQKCYEPSCDLDPTSCNCPPCDCGVNPGYTHYGTIKLER